jgi:molybdopterin-binding protein
VWVNKLGPRRDPGPRFGVLSWRAERPAVVEVTKGATTAHVRIDIGGTIVKSSITNAAVDDLKLVPGKDASAVVKASDVMVGGRIAPRHAP